jgi:hypothetical protein
MYSACGLRIFWFDLQMLTFHVVNLSSAIENTARQDFSRPGSP